MPLSKAVLMELFPGCKNCTAGDGEYTVLLDKWGKEDYCSCCGRPLSDDAWTIFIANLKGAIIMYYVLNFSNHSFVSCDTEEEAREAIHKMITDGTCEGNIEVVEVFSESARFLAKDF